MKKLLTSTLLAVSLCMPAVLHAQEAEYIGGDLIVMLAPNTDVKDIIAQLSEVSGRNTGIRPVKELSAPLRTWLLHYDNTEIAQPVMLRAVHGSRGVMLAQNNHVVHERAIPNDTQYGQQWQHDNIDSEAAWDITTGGLTASGDTIVVAVMENADLPHPDLAANTWHNHNEVPNNNIDDDANGYVDDYNGWNPDGNDDDVYGGPHGTSVAGMIGAVGNNNLGVAGANWTVKIMAVTYGNLTDASVVESYTYPLVMRRLYNQTNGSKGAFVVATNASWGIDGADHTDFPLWCAIYDSLGAEGVLNCGATANNAVDIDVVDDMPTGCESDFMVSVTATNTADMRTFSAWGLTTIDVGAPGDNIYTTQIGGGYGSTSGTSFASPLTAGVIALLYSAPCSNLMDLVHSDPMAGALYVRQALFDGVEQVGNLPGNTVTGGRINSYNSLQLIMNDCGACPNAYDLNAVSPALGTSDLSWSSTNAGPFNLQYRPVGGGTWTTLNSVTSPYTVTGLSDCTDYEFQVEVVCDTITSGWTASYFWTSEGCCVAPSELFIGFVGDNTGNVFWMPVLAATAYDVQISVEGSGIWTTTTGIANTFYEFTGLTACTAYEVQVRTDCNGNPTPWSTSIIFNTSGCGACQDNSYCASISADASEEWIERVQVGTIDNTSGSDDGYGDHTGTTTDLNMGASYLAVLTPGYAGFVYDEYFRVWIDLDQNGDFDGTGELVLDPGTTTAGPLSESFTVPATATEGITRMRIIMEFDVAPATGCEDGYDYGETEDYCVNLIPDSTSGMGELSAALGLLIYPDPADRDVFIDVRGGAAKQLEVQLLDPAARIMVRKALTHGQCTLTTAWLADGLYACRVMEEGRELARAKLIVAH